MPWLIPILGYLLGSIPTAYIAGRLLRGRDIRQMGDGNVGAQNAFRQLGAKVGITVGIIDIGKGALAVLIAQAAGIPLVAVLITGAAAVVGHNWPVFLGVRGGRGEWRGGVAQLSDRGGEVGRELGTRAGWQPGECNVVLFRHGLNSRACRSPHLRTAAWP